MQWMLKNGNSGSSIPEDLKPGPVVELTEEVSEEALLAGEKALRENNVGVVLVAGGQGSRLNYDGPKGCYSIGPLRDDRSLFYYHARKILAMETRYRCEIPLYVMTSAVNHEATRAYFEEKNYFALDPERVFFFKQGMWPTLDRYGMIIRDKPCHIFMAPDGHGGTIAALKNNGMFDDMRERGVETLFYFQVDNPLVEVASPVFIGQHLLAGADMSLKVCAKREATEGLGYICQDADGGSFITEYVNMTEEMMHAKLPDGEFKFKFGSVAIHVFSREFLESVDTMMPLNIARKKIPFFNGSEVVTPHSPNGFKFEKFIFDVMPMAKKVLSVEFAREKEFAPVKNAKGKDSKVTCQAAMIAKWGGWYNDIDVVVPDGTLLDLDPAGADCPAALKRWMAPGQKSLLGNTVI